MRTRRIQASSDPVSAPTAGHQSVLLHEVIAGLQLTPDAVVVDATLGGAGHTRAIAERLSEKGMVVGIDADSAALDRARKALAGVRPQVRLACANFRTLGAVLPTLGVTRVSAFLFDLGWSAYQLTAGRGFSFQSSEPLSMTYAAHHEGYDFTARDIVNEWQEKQIADILYGWGEERFARKIAKAIVARRSLAPIETASDLADVIAHAVPQWYAHRKTHPATKTFQALRIAVNDEIDAISEGFAQALALVVPGGRIAIITFHSIEDRTVKQLFRAAALEKKGIVLTKKPIIPSAEELAENPRARSAKLRIFEKTK